VSEDDDGPDFRGEVWAVVLMALVAALLAWITWLSWHAY
jgi:hypothetical protein